MFSVCLSNSLQAQEYDDEEDALPNYPPGVLATYVDGEGNEVARIDEHVSFRWRADGPDARLAGGPFVATWQGRLFTMVPGTYRLHAYAIGSVKIDLLGRTVLDAAVKTADWLVSEPIELDYGHHPLRIEYRAPKKGGRIALHWSGPQFSLEPVPAWHLFHDQSPSVDGQFERGEQLAHALRCVACHAPQTEHQMPPAPALTRLRGNLSLEWLHEWIQHAGHHADTLPDHGEYAKGIPDATEFVPSRMPSFDFNEDEARAIAEYLLATSEVIDAEEEHIQAADGDVVEGRRLFQTLGCFACHRVDEQGIGGLFGGGDLAHVADKRPPEFFVAWLREPDDANINHRMPIFELDDTEIANLAAYLSSLGATEAESRSFAFDVEAADAERVELGRRLVDQARCAACHRLPEKDRAAWPPVLASLDRSANWNASCLATPERQQLRPGYQLNASQAGAIATYFSSSSPESRTRTVDVGRRLFAENNCTNCHARGLRPGIGPHAASLIDDEPELAERLPALSPPALHGVGDKLTREALIRAISLEQKPLRPWLEVRMPEFELSDEEIAIIADYLIAQDRIPALPPPSDEGLDPSAMQLAGGRLVTSAGFGCTSCHQVGNVVPQDVALAARGTDLSDLGRRIRRPWFDRWVRNPARIVPRMEMPSISVPIRGVLDDDLDAQLASVWHVLNQPDFNPPQPGAIRVVRTRNLPDYDEPAQVLTDVLRVGKRVFIKPLLVGLQNRHNVLFDLQTNRLAGWWIGDTALQRTEGKTWYWEPGGTHLVDIADGQSELLVKGERGWRQPLHRGQFPTEFDWFEQVPGGIRFAQRLQFASKASDAEPVTLQVVQVFTTIGDDHAQSGFRRQVEVAGMPRDAVLRLGPIPPGGDSAWKIASPTIVERQSEFGLCRVVLVAHDGDGCRDGEAGPAIDLTTNANTDVARVTLDYWTDAPLDLFPVLPPELPPLPHRELDVVPGFAGQSLPLSDEIMPTGLAWRPDGTLIVSSLKGRVWLAHDTTGDGLEDTLSPFSDELAAPYGVAAHGEAIDVINKYALLRLYDTDGDGRADRTDTVASGWGHTDDYHDWAVGLVDDGAGGYYITLPCQQDERSEAAAHLRGHVVQLVPRQPSIREPHAYEVVDYAAGLRFPMGLARSRDGSLFCTDNQGHYKPFNELNHLLPGERYGFLNRLERKPGYDPPHRPPAIQIPHPWTRSVNGIAFLDTPPDVRARRGRDVFGPFEGHLVGCEYDTRGLVRMSLQRVGETYQGAVYPFSVRAETGDEALLGPIVCAVAPDGDLYIGNMRDSAWGGGANNGSIVRLQLKESLPPGIAEVRAMDDGFVLDFVQPVDPKLAGDRANYSVSSFRRIRTPAYGGDDVDRQTRRIEAIEVSDDRRHVRLKVDRLLEGFVYEFRLRDLTGTDEPFFPAEAYYTLGRIPEPH